jgi:hypothetical protein
MKLLKRFFNRSAPSPYELANVIDHLPVSQTDNDWRKRRLVEAAERHGKPFKCAGADLPHELLNGDAGVQTREGHRK